MTNGVISDEAWKKALKEHEGQQQYLLQGRNLGKR